MVGYESTNISQIWISIKAKVVLIRNVIFDKDIIWDRKLILYSDNDIKGLDKSEALEIEDIQLVENSKVDKTTSTITC